MKTTSFLAAALVLPWCTSSLSAVTIVAQYQYNPNGDWFADPPVSVANVPQIELVGHPQTASSNVNNIYNYATTTPITSTTVSGISGQGLNYVVQSRNAPLVGGTSAGSLFLRNAAGRFAFRSPSVAGGGATTLVWSGATVPTALAGLTYYLSVGPASGTGGPADWEDGMRLAMQDTGGNWHLSDWTSTGQTPIGGSAPATGTASGLFEISLDSVEWASYAGASLGSGALITFDAGSAVFDPFVGEAQAFGFFTQQQLANDGELRMRMQGFQVVVPEPGSVLLLGLGGMLCAWRRRRA